MEQFAVYVAIDWADQKHDVCLVDASIGKKERLVLKHTAESLDEWAIALRTRFTGPQDCRLPGAIPRPSDLCAVEVRLPGALPRQPADSRLAYREAFSPSRAKDDPTDAEYLVELLIHHRDRLKAWLPDDEKTRTLQLLVEHRRRLVNDRTRISNRLTALLKAYFPQVLCWFDDIRTTLVCDFLLQWPTLETVKRVKKPALEKFFREHNSMRKETNDLRIASIKEAVPLTTDKAVINSSVLMVKALSQQMKTTIEAIREFDREIAALCQTHQDYHLFDSLPGAGPVYGSRLLAAMGTNRERWATADELLCFSGIAPVVERSGKSEWIRWRYFCPKFFRQSFVEYAGESIKHSFWARAYYSSQRTKGKSHQAAVRALAFKWIRIIWKCWQTNTPYNEVTYLESLRKKGSSLLNFAAHNPA